MDWSSGTLDFEKFSGNSADVKSAKQAAPGRPGLISEQPCQVE